MSVNNLSTCLVKLDYFCNYIPVASSIINAVNLFQKCVVLPFMKKSTIESNHYFKYLDQKSFGCCVLLLVPFIGNIMVWLLKMAKAPKDPSPPVDRLNTSNTSTLNNSNRIQSITKAAPWCDDVEPPILPPNWQKHTASQELSVDYMGKHEVKIPAGKNYFTYEGVIVIGWHGSYNPPNHM